MAETSMWEEFGKAICLMLIIEGILPFLYPHRWRQMVAMLAGTKDSHLRLMGLASMLIGLMILLGITH